jgi:hypothetical protein
MNSIGNIKKNHYFCSFRSKAEKHHHLSLYIVLESFALFYGNFCMDLYSVDSDKAMKRGNEA